MIAMLGGLRFGLALVLFLTGLLAVVKPPTYHLWKLSVAVREGGHWMVLPCLLLAASAFRARDPGRATGPLFLAAAVLFGATVPRAYRAAAVLQRAFRQAWGDVAPGPGGFQRRSPLSFVDLFRGIPVPADRPSTHTYARKDGSELRLDFLPARPAGRSAPCVLVIHGGGWDGGDREQLSRLNAFLSAGGYAVASLDYRLAPRYRYPAPVEDVRDALAWLRAHALGLGIDTARFVLLGRSAGGQIALQAAYVDPDPGVRAVVAFYAPADMIFGYRLPTNPLILDSRRLLESYLGGPDRGATHGAYVAASPVEHVSPRVPPTLSLQGRPDVLVSYRHTVHLRDRLEPLGVKHFEVDLPWAPHGYDYVFRGPGSQISLYFLERFLAEATR